jgi:hypothetical protein
MDMLCVGVIIITSVKQQHNNNITTTATTTSTVATKTSNDGFDGGWTCEEITFRTVIGTITKSSQFRQNLKILESMLTRNICKHFDI